MRSSSRASLQDGALSTKVSGTTLSVSPNRDMVIIGGKEGVNLWKLPPLSSDIEPSPTFQQQQQQPQSPTMGGMTPTMTRPVIPTKGNLFYTQAYSTQPTPGFKCEQNHAFRQPKPSSPSEIIFRKVQPIVSLAWNHGISKAHILHVN